jgi:hypothetical protein
VIIVHVVAVVVGAFIALVGVGAGLATLYLRGWTAMDRDSGRSESGYLFLFAAVVAGTVLLEVGVRFATRRLVRWLRATPAS